MVNAIYKTETIKVRTPDGTLYVMILENPDKTINSIRFTIGKAGAPLAAWADAVAAVMTLCVEKGATIEDLIACISGISSDRSARTLDSIVRSGPDGIWRALLLYTRGPEIDKVDIDAGLRGASVGSWARQRR